MDINTVLDEHQNEIMAIPGVVGVGIGSKDGGPAIVIMVNQLSDASRAQLPQSLEGHPVVVEESGEIVAF